jgi:hypothetical protein
MTLDSGDGGTGAAPMSLLDNVGLPIKETLPLLVDKLIQYNLKDDPVHPAHHIWLCLFEKQCLHHLLDGRVIGHLHQCYTNNLLLPHRLKMLKRQV